MTCYRIEDGAIVLKVRLTPKASRDAIDGIKTLADGVDHALARVRAVPEAGGANKALVVLLAKTFKVRKSSISVITGTAARLKQVRIAGPPTVLTGVVATWPHAA
jgi:uncharacterized protein (TIGR00251 family)